MISELKNNKKNILSSSSNINFTSNKIENNLENNSIAINTNNSIINEDEKYNIIVDYREMGTKTPYYLYKNNFNIINGPLEVGDYILTNNYCIERKSISTKDIYQSLNSKHLIEQTVKMGKYYRNIIILLEFEEQIDILNTFEKGIFYKPIILRKLLDLTNITKLEKNNCLFMWSLNCKMSSVMLKSLRKKLNDEVLDIDYCLHINKNNKDSSKNKNNFDNLNIKSNSQKEKTIDSFFSLVNSKTQNNSLNINLNKNEEEDNIKKYENLNHVDYSNETKNKKLDISIEKIKRNLPGVNSSNYNLINNNFKNLYEFITSDKNKLFEIFGRINGTKINSLFNYEFQ